MIYDATKKCKKKQKLRHNFKYSRFGVVLQVTPLVFANNGGSQQLGSAILCTRGSKNRRTKVEVDTANIELVEAI